MESALEILGWYAGRGFTVLLLVVVGTQLLLAPNYSEDGRLFAIVIGIPTFLLLLVILAIQSSAYVRATAREFGTEDMFGASDQMEAMADSTETDEDTTATRMKVLVVILWIVLLLVSIYMIGFLWAILFFSLAFYRVHTGQSWQVSVLYTLVIWGIISIIFVEILNIRFYRGIIALPHPLPF